MKENTVEKEFCPFINLIHFLSKKWVIVVLKSVNDGCKSFSEIEKNLTWVNPRILSNRLKDLIEEEYIEKKFLTKDSKKSIYCLTKKWISLSKHIDSISTWARENIKKED